MQIRRRTLWIIVSISGATLLVLLALIVVPKTLREGRVVSRYTQLLSASFQGNLPRLRELCSARYLASHELKKSAEGGVVGFPRGIHKNFQVWQKGEAMWLCPTNRVGPIYQFVRERSDWRFDGPIGLLGTGGRVDRMPDLSTDSETNADASVDR